MRNKGDKGIRAWLSQRNRQRGVSLVETVIMLPVLMLIGLGIVQYALVYEAKSSLNYATLLSARAGALDHARPEALRVGFAKGLAPLYSPAEGEQGQLEAQRKVGQDILDEYVHFAIINPTTDAFGDFAEDLDLNGQVNDIPNLDLHSFPDTVGRGSGVNIQDANLLKVHITYGTRLLVPFVGPMTASIAQAFTEDPIRLRMLRAGRLPITASATVRMQNFATRNALMLSRNQVESALVGGRIPTPNPIENPGGGGGGGLEPLPGGPGGNGGEGEEPPSEETPPGEEEPPVVIEPPTEEREEETEVEQTTQPPEEEVECTVDAEQESPETQEVETINEEERGLLSRLGSGFLDAVSAVGEAISRGAEAVFERLPSAVQDFIEEAGDVVSGLGEAAGAVFDFLAGVTHGLAQQAQDLASLIADPVEALSGLKQLLTAFIDDPEGTFNLLAQSIFDEVSNDVNVVINCGAFDRGFVIGKHVNPAQFIRVITRLARFANEDLPTAIRNRDCASFSANTPVWTPDGRLNIQALTIDSLVHSRSDQSYTDSPQQVTQLFTREADHYYQLQTEFETINVTAEHPLWVQGKGWTEVKDIKRADPIATKEGDVLVLSNTKINEPIQVHNFSVAHTPNYFVGRSGIWVHNTHCDLGDGDGRRDSDPSRRNVSLSEQRRIHILDGDSTGGGHGPGRGIPGKSEFPSTLTDDEVIDLILDVASNPNSVVTPGRVRGRLEVRGERDGLEILVVLEQDGSIVTAFPENVPRNPR